MNRARVAAVGIPVAFVMLFFAYPFASVIGRGLTQGGGFDLPLDVLAAESTLGVLWFTIWQASASTAATMVIGLPVAWVLARFDFHGRALVRALLVVPFVLPSVVVATAFLALLPAGWERGVPAIMLAHIFFNVPVVARIVSAWWTRLDPALWDVAGTLGAGPVRRLRSVTLPLLGPALAASAALVFLLNFTSFGVVLILGGPTIATLETEIFHQATRLFDLRAAASLSLLQLAAVAVALVATGMLERRSARVAPIAAERQILRRPRGRERAALVVILVTTALGLGLPPAALIEHSLDTPGGYGFDFYRQLAEESPALLVSPWQAVVNSVLLAVAATGLALTIGGLAATAVARRHGGWIDALVMVPLAGSAVMLGLGFVIAFAEEPLDLRGSWWLVPVAQALVAAPFVVRIVGPALRSVDARFREAAAVLGTSPTQVWRKIDLPLVVRALGVATGFGFAISLGEFGATVFVARGEWVTVPVAVFRFLGRPGAVNGGQAAALSVVLMMLTVISVLIAERIATVRGGTI